MVPAFKEHMDWLKTCQEKWLIECEVIIAVMKITAT
jgi:hypothetical protein